jgi:hypothetical protein
MKLQCGAVSPFTCGAKAEQTKLKDSASTILLRNSLIAVQFVMAKWNRSPDSVRMRLVRLA